MSQSSGTVDFNEKPITSEVFRFVSVRNPQRITRQQLNRIGVLYDLGATSDLYADLIAAINDPANATGEAKLAACKALAQTYKQGADWIPDVPAVGALVPAFDGL